MGRINNSIVKLKSQIAACTRIFTVEGILDYSGHVSARLPDNSGFLVQSKHCSRAELTPDDLYTLDFEGNIVDGPTSGNSFPVDELFIHSEIYKTRADVNSILHAHPEVSIIFTVTEGAELVMVRNHGYRWRNGVPIHPDNAHINTSQLGRELVKTLGDCNAALIRAHGIIIVAEDVPSLLIDGVHFINNAHTLLEVLKLGRPKPMTDSELDIFEQRLSRPSHAIKLWKYYTGRARKDGIIPQDWDAEAHVIQKGRAK